MAEHSILAEVQKGNCTGDLEEPVAKIAIKLQYFSIRIISDRKLEVILES